MNSTLDEFDYALPTDRIAQTPAYPRETAKLMILPLHTGKMSHAHVSDLPDYFHSGDVLVINNTKVFHARLHGTISSGRRVELFLIRPTGVEQWIALAKPGKKCTIGDNITIAPDFIASITGKNDDGTLIVSFGISAEEAIRLANVYGDIPIPPYIKTIPREQEYQTVYAKYVGSVAAPTAGFHLTKNILSTLKSKGVEIQEITLHVGLGTFLPIKSDSLEHHTIHTEWVNVTSETARAIMNAKQENRRIIAIGTTTVRTLEGVASLHNGTLVEYSGDVSIFITPGFVFQIIDGMLTNFHLPKSTLIVLVSAFAGVKKIQDAYKDAIDRLYRFYSFGDAMLIT